MNNNLPWQCGCEQPCYQKDHICSLQVACIQCHLHIYQFRATIA